MEIKEKDIFRYRGEKNILVRFYEDKIKELKENHLSEEDIIGE